jgi:hypothetical protein
MKLNLVLTVALGLNACLIYAQDESPKMEAGTNQTNRFYYFEIPSAINGSNLDPSPISNVASNFTESKLSFKLGFPSLFKDAPETKNLKNSGFIQPYFKATNGITTLYKANTSPVEFGITAGYSRVLKHSYWVFLDDNKKATENHSSEAMTWISLIGSIEQGNYNLFTPAESFGQILNKQTETNSSIYLSLNRYFFSRIKKYRPLSSIWSIGLGYAKTNNYSSLKSRTFEEGKLAYNLDSTSYQTVVETTSGRNGSLIIYEGASCFGELFIPILRNKKFGGMYFGNRLTFFGIGKSNHIINGVTGFYVNLKDKKEDGDKPAKDILNFSVTAQFNQLNIAHGSDYIEKNFALILQAAIPLRFN